VCVCVFSLSPCAMVVCMCVLRAAGRAYTQEGVPGESSRGAKYGATEVPVVATLRNKAVSSRKCGRGGVLKSASGGLGSS
jgi:hypothetical protein